MTDDSGNSSQNGTIRRTEGLRAAAEVRIQGRWKYFERYSEKGRVPVVRTEPAFRIMGVWRIGKTTNMKNQLVRKLVSVMTLMSGMILSPECLAATQPWGTALGSFNGVVNYSDDPATMPSPQPRHNLATGFPIDVGLEWECVEYVNRYYYSIYGMNLGTGRNAKDFYSNNTPSGITRCANGGTTGPQVGDILCFGQTGSGFGHVAIVRSVDQANAVVHVIQQNVKNGGSSPNGYGTDDDWKFAYTVSGGAYTVDVISAGSSRLGPTFYCQGWLRQTTTTPTAAEITGFGGNGAGWTLNGYYIFDTYGFPQPDPFPSVINDVLSLTDIDSYYNSRSAFFNTPHAIGTFTASFTYQNLTGLHQGGGPWGGINNPADGIVFTIQNQGPTAIGTPAYTGSGLGYQGITSASGIALNVHDGHIVGIGYAPTSVGNGSYSYSSVAPVDLLSLHPINVTITYDGTNLRVGLVDTVSQASFSATYAVNLEQDVGGSTAYVGFTGATGAGASDQRISNFLFTSPAPSLKQAAAPVFNPSQGTFSGSVTVHASTTTTGTTIRYTTNGSEPTNTSVVFPGAGLKLTSTTTVKAKAFKNGMTASTTTWGTYTAVLQQVVPPVFNPAPGIFSAAVTVRAKTTTSGAIIRYTTTPSDPTTTSPVFPSAGLTLSSTATLNARAFKTGMADSTVTTGTYTINIAQVAPPTFSPSPGNYNNVQSVTISTTTSGATIRYTINGTDPTTSSSLYTRPVNISSTTTLSARAFKSAMTESVVTRESYTIQLPSIVLLLHGMNSDPATWNDLIDDHNYFPAYVPIVNVNVPTAPVIFGGVVLSASGANPTLDKNGVRYFRVQFGAYDLSYGRTGVEGIHANLDNSGDFISLFGTYSLAREVKDAVATIINLYPSANILLVGHSRGGIAGRAFLETATYGERSAVVGLLTVGTPHQGSPFGNIYNYLTSNPDPMNASGQRTSTNPNLISDWGLVDKLRSSGVLEFINDTVDVRRPTIGDLAPGSAALSLLTSLTSRLPTAIPYGTLMFDGAQFGILYEGPPGLAPGTLDVLNGSSESVYLIVPYKLSTVASNYLCKPFGATTYHGDGIVPVTFQTFSASGINKIGFSNTAGILHINEPSDKTDIRSAMKTLVNWWN